MAKGNIGSPTQAVVGRNSCDLGHSILHFRNLLVHLLYLQNQYVHILRTTNLPMPKYAITRADFLEDRQGRTFSDVLNDPDQPLDEVLAFFSDKDRQRRMEESEIHHDRAPLAGVVRELESQPAVHRFLSEIHARRSQRLRQAIGVVVRMVMERRGWQKTGRKGSLGVRADRTRSKPAHNTGGLALWFLRAERYTLPDGMPYRTVQVRRQEISKRRPKNRATKA